MKKYWMVAALCLLFPLVSLNAQEESKMNKKNLVVKEWNTDAKGSHKVLDHVTTYNSDGRKIEEIEYNTDGQKWRKRYEYDASGKLSKEYVYDQRNRLQTYKTFEFNEFSKKKVQYTYNPKGRLIGIKQFEYVAQ
ncbi:MAG: hypothetical protein J5646_02560 [Bacteroidales bacterium]|nr:hypothetical protein [Bacteroidales bacterium]